MITRDDISQHLLVCMPDVRRRVRVIDRRSDEKRFRHVAKLTDSGLEWIRRQEIRGICVIRVNDHARF